MGKKIRDFYKERKEVGLNFIRDEINLEIIKEQKDEKYLTALIIVRDTINATIVREGKG